MSDAQESYERAHAQHRETRSAGGAGSVDDAILAVVGGGKPFSVGDVAHVQALAHLGARALEALCVPVDCRRKTLGEINTETLSHIQRAAFELGLLPVKAREGEAPGAVERPTQRDLDRESLNRQNEERHERGEIQ